MANKSSKIARAALMSAVVAIISQLSIPIGAVPLTLQIFAVSLVGYILGWKWGSVSVIIYLGLGAVGAPVFASLQGGAHMLLGYTGGFIWGFLPLCALCGVGNRKKIKLILGILGTIICHLMGVLQYSYISELGILKSSIAVSLPFILKDIILVFLSFTVSEKINQQLKK